MRAMAERGINCPRASSAGRLFDAAAGLLGLGDEVSLRRPGSRRTGSARPVTSTPTRCRGALVRAEGLWVYDPVATLTALLEELAAGVPVPRIAAAFHTTIAEATAALVAHRGRRSPRGPCACPAAASRTSGCSAAAQLLRAQGLRVLVGSAVPVNDGGISYGQAAVAAARLAKAKG